MTMLRRLEEKDAPYMLEWMHDDTVNCWFRYPFADITMEKAIFFIRYSFDEENQHFAITDKKDEYLGRSASNISPKRITTRSLSLHQGKWHRAQGLWSTR